MKDKDRFIKIFSMITEGRALRNALRDVKMSSETFYNEINKDESLALQYARATEERATALVEDMLEIADEETDNTHRARLRVDTRKWIASKLRPKKYGDSHQVKIADNDGGKLKINAIFNTDLLNVPTNDSTKED